MPAGSPINKDEEKIKKYEKDAKFKKIPESKKIGRKKNLFNSITHKSLKQIRPISKIIKKKIKNRLNLFLKFEKEL